ncbi:MAG: hypothetical protein F6K48_01345 [Okeania sp. SIO3H1]|nr:hypothetical protein [Okeania sp. SIO3H1]
MRGTKKPTLNVDMSKSKSKSKSNYRISNWSEYDASLKQRGSLTFWLTLEVIEQWVNQEKTGRRGASNTYSDVATLINGLPK